MKGLGRISVACILVQTAFAQVVFFDGTFDDADWQADVFQHNNGGSLTVTQEPTGGNPGSYARVSHTVNPPGTDYSIINTFHWRTNAVYDPQMAGAIASIDYLEDSILIPSPTPRRTGQHSGPVIRQGTNIYIQLGFDTPKLSWTRNTVPNLLATDFWLWDPNEGPNVDVNQHPDFSENGLPLYFGFRRGTSGGMPQPAGATIVGGIDNWTVTVHSVYQPRLNIRLSQFALCWDTITNLVYQLQYQSDLTTNEWAPLGGLIVGDGSMVLHKRHLFPGREAVLPTRRDKCRAITEHTGESKSSRE